MNPGVKIILIWLVCALVFWLAMPDREVGE